MWLLVVDWEQRWLYNLTAAGRTDLRYLSLSLKELSSDVGVSCRGWESFTITDDSLAIMTIVFVCPDVTNHIPSNIIHIQNPPSHIFYFIYKTHVFLMTFS